MDTLKKWITISGRDMMGLKWRSSSLFICATVGIGIFTDIFLYSLIGMCSKAEVYTYTPQKTDKTNF